MEMVEEEFWQKAFLAYTQGKDGAVISVVEPDGSTPAAPPTVAELAGHFADEAVLEWKRRFHKETLPATEPDMGTVKSNCPRCKALNVRELDLNDYPENSQVNTECIQCGAAYHYKIEVN